MIDLIFPTLLAHYIAAELLRHGLREGLRRLDEIIAKIEIEGLPSHTPLSEENKKLVEAIRHVKHATWKRFILFFHKKEKRPVLIVGPSGTGKSYLAARLCRGMIDKKIVMSNKVERDKILAGYKKYGIITAPGDYLHAPSAVSKIKNIFESNNPPKVICIVVSDGFLATQSDLLIGTRSRPNRSEPAADTKSFLRICQREETSYLEDIAGMTRKKLSERIPSVITVINKKDLWIPYNKYSSSTQIPGRYLNEKSSFNKLINKLLKQWGKAQKSTYDILPCYTYGGGFHPDTRIRSLALTQEQSEADLLILKALIYYRYREGAV